MVLMILAAVAALVLLGIFGNASDHTIKIVAGKILLVVAAGFVIVPLVLWCLRAFSPFVVIVLFLFVLFRWLFRSSPTVTDD